MVYLLHSTADAASRALGERGLRGSGDGLMEHCARAGCLLGHTLEYLSCCSDGLDRPRGRVPEYDSGSENMTGVECSGRGWEREPGPASGLAKYAAMGVDFLQLRHHFDQWAAAADSGAFQECLRAAPER